MALDRSGLPAVVTVVQGVLPHYRVPFFDALHTRLAERGIAVHVLYGQHKPQTVPETVMVDRPWARFATNRYLSLMGRALVWQPVIRETRGADLVIMEHAARMVMNHALYAFRLARRQRLAYWGHGANFQASRPNALVERAKRKAMRHVDWWFTYTDTGKAIVERSGFPVERITVVENAIDDSEMTAALAAVTEEQIKNEKERLRIRSDRIALFCGSMRQDKRLGFLLDACHQVRAQLSDFEVIFVGSGPEEPLIRDACSKHRWMHFVGPKLGRARAVYFAMSRVLAMPGAVGLIIADSFIAGVPLFTTDIPFHGPEIAYLRLGVNGIVTADSVVDFAESLISHLAQPCALERLRAGCIEARDHYTLRNMVSNFASGVESCLVAPLR